MKLKACLFLASASLFCGCATQQLRFQTWKGVAPEALEDVQKGVFPISKEKLLDAAAATLEHEPYLHWTFDNLDKANGLLVGSAGLFREVQVRVEQDSADKSHMAVSVPRRALKTQAKVYILKSDSSHLTAYEPKAEDLDKYNVVAADVELDPAYFYAFTYHVLGDHMQVPFTLTPYDGAAAVSKTLPDDPAPSPAVTPVAAATAPSTVAGPDATPEKTPALSPEPTVPPAHRE